MVPGSGYAAGSLRSFFLGAHYRDVWTEPLRVPTLDLETFAGGLRPVRDHAGSQTASLRFEAGDGRTYQFRSVFKTPSATLPELYRGTLVARMIQDGASASHPTGALVVSPLLEAVGVLHAPPTLAVMPDDPALGEFRERFAGVLGIIEERPDEADDEGRGGFGSALKVIGPDRLFERLDESPADRVDARAFLTARLVDILVGDRDRHRDNWRWALLRDDRPFRLWLPVSRDHDEAFVKLDGLLLGLAARYRPQLVSFGPEYPNPVNLNWHAREVDRRFLAGLDRAAWDSTAAWVQSRLTDGVVDDAVRRLPPEQYAVGGPELAAALRARRDGLREEARRYYALLAREIDIRATDAPEVLDVHYVDDRFVDVSLRERGGDSPFFSRRFDALETDEVRVAMWGGDDRVVVHGAGGADLLLRVVGGSGRDAFVDTAPAARVRFYDSGAHTSAELGGRATLDTSPHVEWVGSDVDRYPPREWGRWARPGVFAGIGPNFGALLGAEFAVTRYGFRREPFASELRLGLGLATGDGWGRMEVTAVDYRENSRARLELRAGVSGVDLLRYHGLGNDTEREVSPRHFFVELSQVRVEPRAVVPVGPRGEAWLGAFARFSTTSGDESPFFRSIEDTLYGAGSFGRVGLRGGVEVDTRDRATPGAPGLRLRGDVELVPALWDVREAYARAGVEGSVRLTARSAPLSPALILRGGGSVTRGEAPFQEAVYLGGRSNLRGWSAERFAGDAALFGGAELRLRLGGVHLVLPGEGGVLGLADFGRVYVDGRSPGGWHAGFGGGVWFSVLDAAGSVSLAVARGRERTALYAGIDVGR